MSIPASANHEEKYEVEIYLNIATVAAIYGDKKGTYLGYVKNHRPGFMRDLYILHGGWMSFLENCLRW